MTYYIAVLAIQDGKTAIDRVKYTARSMQNENEFRSAIGYAKLQEVIKYLEDVGKS